MSILRWLFAFRCGCGKWIYEEADEYGVSVCYDAKNGLPHSCRPHVSRAA